MVGQSLLRNWPKLVAQSFPNMPLTLHPSQIGRGWREVQDGEPLTTLTQSYLPHKEVWVDGAILAKDGIRNMGRMNYRQPASWYAYVWAVYKALPKLWRRYVKGSQW